MARKNVFLARGGRASETKTNTRTKKPKKKQVLTHICAEEGLSSAPFGGRASARDGAAAEGGGPRVRKGFSYPTSGAARQALVC
jgi:hypothetical protein